MDFFTADLHLGHANILKFSRRLAFMTPADLAAFLEVEAAAKAATKGKAIPRLKPGEAMIQRPTAELDRQASHPAVEAFNKWRPSKESVERMDEGLIELINAAVGKSDTLWIVGDFAKPKGEKASDYRRYRDAIRAKDVRLIWGNHDNRHKCAGLFTQTYEAVMLYVDAPGGTALQSSASGGTALQSGASGGPALTHAELFESKGGRQLLADAQFRSRTRRVFLSHYCHVVWHHSHRGVYHLYGHSHGNLEAWREEHMPSALAMDVGVDCWECRPLSFTEIDHLLTAKAAKVPPHTVDFGSSGAED
ncbi:MAG: metallophosphoesterase [Planctomycetota bacterium]